MQTLQSASQCREQFELPPAPEKTMPLILIKARFIARTKIYLFPLLISAFEVITLLLDSILNQIALSLVRDVCLFVPKQTFLPVSYLLAH